MTDKKREGFSYISPEKERKSASKVLLLEIVVLFIIGVGIVAALIYLGVIKLPGGVEKVDNQPNQVKKVEKALDSDLYAVDKTVVPVIEVVSDTPDISIKVTDKKGLAQFTNKYTIFGRKYYLGEGKYSEILKKLIIHLTDKEQPNNKYFLLKKVPVSSTGIIFDGNTLNLYVFLSDEAYTNKISTPEIFFEQSILTAAFRMSYNPIGGKMNPDKENELIKLVQQVNKDSSRYVEITKNIKNKNK